MNKINKSEARTLREKFATELSNIPDELSTPYLMRI